MITLMVNGAPRELARSSTIAALLGTLGIDPRLVVVEHNEVSVPSSPLTGMLDS